MCVPWAPLGVLAVCVNTWSLKEPESELNSRIEQLSPASCAALVSLVAEQTEVCRALLVAQKTTKHKDPTHCGCWNSLVSGLIALIFM